jgi:hypothetical protein
MSTRSPRPTSSTKDRAVDRPDIDDRALAGLKFSAALPHRLAVATLAARLADLSKAATVLNVPAISNNTERAQRRPPSRSARRPRRSPISSRYHASVARSQLSGRCQGIGRRPSSPLYPVRPISSPAKIIGTPGSVINSPTATSIRAGSSTTVRIRGVSCEPSRVHELTSARHDIRPAKARIVATTAGPARRGTPPGTPRKSGSANASDCNQAHSGRVNPA